VNPDVPFLPSQTSRTTLEGVRPLEPITAIASADRLPTGRDCHDELLSGCAGEFVGSSPTVAMFSAATTLQRGLRLPGESVNALLNSDRSPMNSPPRAASRSRGRTADGTISEQDISSAHLVGARGAGMKALSEMLTGLGWRLTGSDQRPSDSLTQTLHQRGLRIHFGHHDQFLPRNVDVLIHSPAVGPGNPERRRAAQLGIPQLSYSRMLGLLMNSRTGISIAGTHGKSTTTAMTATILEDAALAPSAVMGAELCGSGLSGWAGEGDLFVVESCEYQRSFLDLSPRYAAILGIEPDHFDCYRDIDDLTAAFAEFAGQVAEDGLLLIPAECEASQKAARWSEAPVETFSRAPHADWWAGDVRQTGWGLRFRVFYCGQYLTEIGLQTPCEHNILNALAAIALSHHAGVPADIIRDSLGEFPGIRRRFEQGGSWRGVTLIDDYAHHPTAVRSTLQTVRRQFGRRRVWCAFQPHQISRTQALMDEFAASFSDADHVLIPPVFAAREQSGDEPGQIAEQLVSQIVAEGTSARFCPSLDQIVRTLDDEAQPGDVLITMGAGDIDQVRHELTRRIRRHHAAG